jgi:caffeoyl-CoA O-methyltransferase
MLLIPEDIERYTIEHSSPEPALFRELAKETRDRTSDPGMQVGHVEGTFLKLIARSLRAQRVLEIGTFTGYSALKLAEGTVDGGIVVTCDVDRKATDIARKYWDQSPHGHKIVLKLGRALDTIEAETGFFDLVFIDADKERYVQYWEAVLPKVRSGGVILADNVLWSGRVLKPEAPSDHAIVAFNEHVRRDRRVEVVMLPVRDGVTMACKL